jgi:hypothetical protein
MASTKEPPSTMFIDYTKCEAAVRMAVMHAIKRLKVSPFLFPVAIHHP